MDKSFQLSAVALVVACCAYITMAGTVTLQLPKNGLGAKGSQIDVTTLLDWPDTESFLNHAKNSKPFIVRGAAKSWPAYSKWTDENFLRSFEEEGKKEGVTVEQGKKEDRDSPAEEISFHKFVSRYQKEDWYMVNGVPQFLRNDIVMPPLFHCPAIADLLLKQMMWFSSGGTKSVLHFDYMDNIHCLIDGKKLFILIDPNSKVDIDQPQGSYCSVDVDNVDYGKYPDLLNIEYHFANLTAGDCLYLPYYWYHQVRGIDRNIGINIWWDHHTMMTEDFSDCIDATAAKAEPSSKHHLDKTMDQFVFHGTAKLMQHEEIVKSRITMLASQGGSPLTFKRLLTMILGSEEIRANMGHDEKAERIIQTIFNTLDYNLDGHVLPAELETLPKERWSVIQTELQRMQQHFEDIATAEQDESDLDEGVLRNDWIDEESHEGAIYDWIDDDDLQYDNHGDAMFVDDQDMDYMDTYSDLKDEL